MAIRSCRRKTRRASTYWRGVRSADSDLAMPVLVIPYPTFDPVLLQLGPFAIRWYALAYIFGILIGWAYARLLIRSTKLWGRKAPMTVTDFDDFVLWVTIGIILGGRIGYVLFYNLPYFIEHPIEIVQLWNGGMSFHGGFIGCVLAVLLFGYTRGISVLSLGDITCAVGPIGLFLGRLANFINGELWGRPYGRALGHDISERRTDTATSESALRGRARRFVASRCSRTPGARRRSQAARPDHWKLRCRLRSRTHIL